MLDSVLLSAFGVSLADAERLLGIPVKNTTSIRLGASPLVTIDSTMIPKPATQPEVAVSDATRYDISQFDQYLADINLKEYLRSVAVSLGMEPDRLIELY